MRSTPLTWLLLLALAAGYVLEVASGGSTDTAVLVALGANVPELVLAGQVWRLLASVFLHIGILHLLLNGWALHQLGGLFETLAGPRRLALVFLAGGVSGSLASVAWNLVRGRSSLSAGASGAVFALLAALAGLLWRRRERLRPAGRALLSSLGLWAAINVYIGVTTPFIDNAAHLGGAVAGLLLGLVVKARGDRPAVPAPLT